MTNYTVEVELICSDNFSRDRVAGMCVNEMQTQLGECHINLKVYVGVYVCIWGWLGVRGVPVWTVTLFTSGRWYERRQ